MSCLWDASVLSPEFAVSMMPFPPKNGPARAYNR